MFDKILCAVDGSDHSRRAAHTAAVMAQQFNASLTILTVTREIEPSPAIKRYLELEQLSGEPQYVLDAMTEKVLGEAEDEARSASGIKSVKTEVLTGPRARTIVDYAKREKMDAVVMGSRGLGDVEAILLGSVSHKVASLATCSVIVVR